uniref:FA complementation group F n=1 Tax=Malurus cyaneus samueli TaxID=2593467 RepID=A0A8C5UJH8_9PASS
MEAVLGQVEQLPALLAVSRSALVRDWDSLTLDRALEWALREALERRLRRAQPYPPLGFPALGRCPQLLGLALLENRALPPAACHRLLRGFLQPPGSGAGSEPSACAAPPLPRPEPELSGGGGGGAAAAGRLREEKRQPWLCGALEQLPQPRSLQVVAAALALLGSPHGCQASAAGDGCTAELLLSWLLGNQERISAFCLCLPGSLLAFLAGRYSQLSRVYLDLLTGWGSRLLYDPLQGRWIKSCHEKAELSWEELRERFNCLCQGSTVLKEQTQAALKLLKTWDGDFEVRGLSVWTDLLKLEQGSFYLSTVIKMSIVAQK